MPLSMLLSQVRLDCFLLVTHLHCWHGMYSMRLRLMEHMPICYRIGEKFLDWSDDEPPLDTILRAVTLYWLTDTFPTSIYSYRQVRPPCVQQEGKANTRPTQDDSPERLKALGGPKYISKPFGYSWFPKEIHPTPQSWVATLGDLVFFRRHTKVSLLSVDT